jgi:hypothetical protein
MQSTVHSARNSVNGGKRTVDDGSIMEQANDIARWYCVFEEVSETLLCTPVYSLAFLQPFKGIIESLFGNLLSNNNPCKILREINENDKNILKRKVKKYRRN